MLTKLILDHQRRNNAEVANTTGKCVLSADQALHYCGFSEEGRQNAVL